ncbi:MAG: hypothetical protein K2X62_12290, partial [Beijerinckiaceae bacterium]|nr:hypothetical protein [Beijerinckiaceae bacterium]
SPGSFLIRPQIAAASMTRSQPWPPLSKAPLARLRNHAHLPGKAVRKPVIGSRHDLSQKEPHQDAPY